MSGFGRAKHKKWRAPTNPLDAEASKGVLEDLPGRKFNNKDLYISKRIKELENLGRAKSEAEKAELQALVKIRADSQIEAFAASQDDTFVSDFQNFLQGRMKYEEAQRVNWKVDPVQVGVSPNGEPVYRSQAIRLNHLPGVQEYLDKYANARLKYEQAIERMKKLGPVGLDGHVDRDVLYVYYKYVVRGVTTGVDEFLRDWKFFDDRKTPQLGYLQGQEAGHANSFEAKQRSRESHMDSNGETAAPPHDALGNQTILRSQATESPDPIRTLTEDDKKQADEAQLEAAVKAGLDPKLVKAMSEAANNMSKTGALAKAIDDLRKATTPKKLTKKEQDAQTLKEKQEHAARVQAEAAAIATAVQAHLAQFITTFPQQSGTPPDIAKLQSELAKAQQTISGLKVQAATDKGASALSVQQAEQKASTANTNAAQAQTAADAATARAEAAEKAIADLKGIVRGLEDQLANPPPPPPPPAGSSLTPTYNPAAVGTGSPNLPLPPTPTTDVTMTDPIETQSASDAGDPEREKEEEEIKDMMRAAAAKVKAQRKRELASLLEKFPNMAADEAMHFLATGEKPNYMSNPADVKTEPKKESIDPLDAAVEKALEEHAKREAAELRHRRAMDILNVTGATPPTATPTPAPAAPEPPNTLSTRPEDIGSTFQNTTLDRNMIRYLKEALVNGGPEELQHLDRLEEYKMSELLQMTGEDLQDIMEGRPVELDDDDESELGTAEVKPPLAPKAPKVRMKGEPPQQGMVGQLPPPAPASPRGFIGRVGDAINSAGRSLTGRSPQGTSYPGLAEPVQPERPPSVENLTTPGAEDLDDDDDDFEEEDENPMTWDDARLIDTLPDTVEHVDDLREAANEWRDNIVAQAMKWADTTFGRPAGTTSAETTAFAMQADTIPRIAEILQNHESYTIDQVRQIVDGSFPNGPWMPNNVPYTDASIEEAMNLLEAHTAMMKMNEMDPGNAIEGPPPGPTENVVDPVTATDKQTKAVFLAVQGRNASYHNPNPVIRGMLTNGSRDQGIFDEVHAYLSQGLTQDDWDNLMYNYISGDDDRQRTVAAFVLEGLVGAGTVSQDDLIEYNALMQNAMKQTSGTAIQTGSAIKRRKNVSNLLKGPSTDTKFKRMARNIQRDKGKQKMEEGRRLMAAAEPPRQSTSRTNTTSASSNVRKRGGRRKATTPPTPRSRRDNKR